MRLEALLSREVLNCQHSLIVFSFWYIILILQQIPLSGVLLLENTYLSYNSQVNIHISPLTLFKKSSFPISI